MLELYIILTMVGIGYIVNKTQNAPMIKKLSYPKSEKPSMDNVYNSKYSDETLRILANKVNQKYQMSRNPQDTGVIGLNYPLLKDADKIKSMNGTYIEKDNFTHNNMIPFFGGSIRQNTEPFANSSVLLNHNGTDDLYKTKTEVKSFFEQCQDVGNVNGMDNKNDYYRERMVAPTVKNNVFPIPQVKVGPGVNRGFSSSPTGGYQQYDTRDYVMPKNVDELRVADKPKVTFAGKTIDGQKAKVRGELGVVNKNTPDTYYEQTQDMWLKTTGACTKGMVNPAQIVKETNRQDTTTEYVGSAYGQDQKQRVKDPSVQSTRRPVLEKFDVGSAVITKHGAKETFDHGKSNILVYENERDITTTRVYQGNITSLIKSIIAPIVDMVKVTKKDETIDNPRHFGNLSMQIPDKATLYDPNDVARTTLKEQLIHDNVVGNLKGNEKLTIYDPNDIARTTLKEQLIHDNVVGNLKGNEKNTVYDPNDIARTTLKEQLIHDNVVGNLKGNEKLTINDTNDMARTTLKEQLIHDNTLGNFKGNEKLTIYDPNDVTRTTLKEQLIHDNTLGNFKGNEKLTIYDPNDIARTTLKEQLIHDNMLGNFKGNEKLTIYDPNDIARTTLKEQLIHDSVLANLSGPVQLTIYDPEDVARTTTRETMKYQDTNVNLMGHVANQKYLSDKAKKTMAETLIDTKRDGNISRIQASDAYDFVDWEVKMTQKQFLSDHDYYGAAARDKGEGYVTNEYEARQTQKQLLSDNDFYGIAVASENKKHVSTDDVGRMTIKPNMESVIFGRDPTKTANKTYSSVECVNIVNRKNQCDIANVRETPNTDKVYNEIPSTEELALTKMKKDYRQYDNERLDTIILKSTLDNPLNINVASQL